VFSRPLIEHFDELGIPVAQVHTNRVFDDKPGRKILSHLRLLCDANDSLAWRTILQLADGIGPKTMKPLYGLARDRDYRFANAVMDILDSPALVPRTGVNGHDRILISGQQNSPLSDTKIPTVGQ